MNVSVGQVHRREKALGGVEKPRTGFRLAAMTAVLIAALPGSSEAGGGPQRGVSVHDKSGIEREVFGYFGDFGRGDVDAI